MTDREVMMALYSAIEAVYEKLTGERLTITVPINNGADQVSITSLGFFAERRLSSESCA